MDGGLISYGADINDAYRRSADYVDRISRAPTQASFRFNTRPNLNM
jgi:hypothetical protein